MLPFTARSQNPFIIGAYDALIPFLRRCRSCVATVDAEALLVSLASAAAALEQRRSDNEVKKEFSRERVVCNHKSAQNIARPEVKEPEVPSGVFAYFCHC